MAFLSPLSPSLTSTLSGEDLDDIFVASALRLPLPVISDILVRSSDGGHVRDLIQYSVVCRTFHAAVKGIRVLKISRLSLEKKDSDTRQYILARIVHVAPCVKELSFGDKGGSFQDISPSTILYWSTVIRRTLKRFLAFNCSFSAAHLNALNEMEVLNSVSLTECRFNSNRAAMSNCNPLSIERLSLDKVQFVESDFLHDILQVLPQLLVLQCVTTRDYTREGRPAISVLSVKSNSLSTLKINAYAGVVYINTPNLEKLLLHTGCSCRFDIGISKNLKSFMYSNDISEGLSSRSATITIQSPLPASLEELSPLGETNQLLCQNLLWSNANTLKSLTLCGDPPTGSGDAPIGRDVHPLPCLLKLCFENIPIDKELANRVRPWLRVCRKLEEVAIVFKAAPLNSTDVFASVQETLWMQRLYPKVKFSTPWT